MWMFIFTIGLIGVMTACNKRNESGAEIQTGMSRKEIERHVLQNDSLAGVTPNQPAK
jgi:hypothetical protein